MYSVLPAPYAVVEKASTCPTRVSEGELHTFVCKGIVCNVSQICGSDQYRGD